MKKYLLLVCIVLPAILSGQPRTVFDGGNFNVNMAEKVNTVGSDISPFFVGGDMFYSSVRKEYLNNENRERKNKAFYDMYSAKVDGEGEIVAERELLPGFGGNYHEGPAAYCSATGELFVTLSNVDNPVCTPRMIPVERIKLRLVVMTKTEGIWKIKEELPFNDNQYSFAHPAVSSTGDTLVFSGNTDASGNDTDLYMSVRQNGVWSDPVGLSDKINTEGNEGFPVFIGNGILAFASDGRGDCLGGLDIYYTEFPGMETVKSMAKPVNSEYDDFGLMMGYNGKIGYFCSNRPGGKGGDDIFMIDTEN